MRVFIAGFTVAVALCAQAPETSPERIRELVKAGALPRARLQDMRESAEASRDTEILNRTLYGALGIEDLTEEQGTAMIAAAERQYGRSRAKLEAARKLVDEGVAARNTLEPFEQDLNRAAKTVEDARSRAGLLTELVEMARAEEAAAAAEDLPDDPVEDRSVVVVRYEGNGVFTQKHLKEIVLAFEAEFDRKLPISARGATALHRTLHFDHTGRVDVALNPDQAEGVWLRRYLENARIPYFAFRRFVPGKATAPHIHIGPPSLRLRNAD